jgi:hypothetical protein
MIPPGYEAPCSPIMRSVQPRFIRSRTYALFFHRFPVVQEAEFWHNRGMPNRAEKNAATPEAVLPAARPESALPTNDPIDNPIDDLNTSPRPRDDRAATERSARKSPAGASDRAASEGTPSGEIGGPTGPEPTRFGDWEKKGRCIDF